MSSEIQVTIGNDFVAIVEICKPPNNFFSTNLISGLAETFEQLDQDDRVRASVLCSQGKHFCAGADFSGDSEGNDTLGLYAGAVRIFRSVKPIVGAIQGAAIGGGLGGKGFGLRINISDPSLQSLRITQSTVRGWS